MIKKFFKVICRNSKKISNMSLSIGIGFIIISAIFDAIGFHK